MFPELDVKNLRAVGNTVLIVPKTADMVTKSGLYLPYRQNEKTNIGLVLAVGPEVKTEGLVAGVDVMYDVHSGLDVDASIDVYAINEDGVFAIIDELHPDKIRIIRDYVLVHPNLEENDSFRTKSGILIYSDNTYNEERHAVVRAVVKSVPQKLSEDLSVELVPEDLVYFHFLAMKRASKYGLSFKIEDEVYLLVRYASCRAVERTVDGKTEGVPVNDYILVEPVTIDEPESAIIIPEEFRKKKHNVVGRIKYMGENIHDHFHDLKVGNLIVFEKESDVPLEAKEHRNFMGGDELYVMKRPQVLAIIEEHEPKNTKS